MTILEKINEANTKYGFGYAPLISGESLGDGRAREICDLAFAAQLDSVLGAFEEMSPERLQELKTVDELVVADLGCGFMPYAHSLYQVFSRINPSLRVFGMDWDKLEIDILNNSVLSRHPNDKVVGVHGEIKDLEEHLGRYNVGKAHVITLFNPSTGRPFPNLASIKPASIKGAVLIGSAEGDASAIPLYEGGLEENGFAIMHRQQNDFSRYFFKMILGYKSTPWYVAVQREVA